MQEAGAEPPLKEWRQGDLILAPFSLPVVSARSGVQSTIIRLTAEHGIAIVSQSCDIVKGTENCPYVQVAPLIRVDEDEATQIRRGKRPRLVIIPGLEEKGLAIDLDACATVLKDAIVSEERVCGCPDDGAQAYLGKALARHRGRFAFPDDFNDEVAATIAKWISEKYKKQSPQGDLIQSIVEVRVTTDSWTNPSFLTLYLLRNSPLPAVWPKEWKDAIAGVAKKASASKRYPDIDIVLTTFDDISAAEYRASYELDWDGLSTSR